MYKKTSISEQKRIVYSRKRLVDKIVSAILCIVMFIFLVPFLLLIVNVIAQGLPLLTLEFILETPRRGGTQGGILNAITGSALMVSIAIILSLPLALGGAIFITEYVSSGKLRKGIETTSDILAGVPSIVYGAFGFAFFIECLRLPISALVGGLTLGLMMIPTVLRVTQEAILAIPNELREASLALGATRITTTFKITLRAAFPAIVSGILLAIGRVIGETAPLLFTAGYSIYVPTSPCDWAASLPFIIFKFWSESFRPDMMRRAYSAALFLMMMVFLIDLVANYICRKIRWKFI
ncbi:MAG: phosphate ABC transporter permease PstA [Candidatus Ranarchaeia archaeon]